MVGFRLIIIACVALVSSAQAAPHVAVMEYRSPVNVPVFPLLQETYHGLPAEEERAPVTQNVYEPGYHILHKQVAPFIAETKEAGFEAVRQFHHGDVNEPPMGGPSEDGELPMQSGRAAITDQTQDQVTGGIASGTHIREPASPIAPRAPAGSDTGLQRQDPSAYGASAQEFAQWAQAAIVPLSLGFLLLALFSRLRTGRLSEHPIRRQILERVEAEPGVRLHEITANLKHSRSLVDYHIRMLDQHGSLRIVKRAKAKHLFPADHVPHAKELVIALSNPRTAEVYRVLQGRPGARLKDIQVILDMLPSLAHWHLSRLLDEGVVTVDRSGRPRYFVA